MQVVCPAGRVERGMVVREAECAYASLGGGEDYQHGRRLLIK